MASGWWNTSFENLEEVSPVDLAITTNLAAPRGYPKLASIATGSGLFLGGTPCIVLDNVIYYAGDGYTQNTDKPILLRYDGRIAAQVLEIPHVGVTPAKAILSLATDGEDCIYISTWDSGTTSSNFAGRVFCYSILDGTLEQLGSDIYTGGRLPYALAFFNDKLYIGTINQDPVSGSLIRTINPDTEVEDYVPDVSTTTTYRITLTNVNGSESGGNTAVSVTQRAALNAEASNLISWGAPTELTGLGNYNLYRTAGHSSTGIISTSFPPFTDDGDAGSGASVPAAPTTVAPVSGGCNSLESGGTSYRYAFTCVRSGNESYPTFSNTITNGPSSQSSSSNNMNLICNIADSDGLTTVNIYRTVGPGTFGFIKSVASTVSSTVVNVFDNVANGNGVYPKVNPAAIVLSVTKTNPKLFTGGVGCLVPFNGKLYAGTYTAAASGFGSVYEITSANAVSTSLTAAPGGAATDYNGYTAGCVFNDNLYMAFWYDAATNILLIQKFNGTTWSDVAVSSGASARPIVAMAVINDVLYAYGGGDALTGILLSSVDGAVWVDQSALLPTSKEAIPFLANANILGGF